MCGVENSGRGALRTNRTCNKRKSVRQGKEVQLNSILLLVVQQSSLCIDAIKLFEIISYYLALQNNCFNSARKIWNKIICLWIIIRTYFWPQYLIPRLVLLYSTTLLSFPLFKYTLSRMQPNNSVTHFITRGGVNRKGLLSGDISANANRLALCI